jgi:hypothetical protein
MNRQEQAVALLAVAAIERLGGSDEELALALAAVRRRIDALVNTAVVDGDGNIVIGLGTVGMSVSPGGLGE